MNQSHRFVGFGACFCNQIQPSPNQRKSFCWLRSPHFWQEDQGNELNLSSPLYRPSGGEIYHTELIRRKPDLNLPARVAATNNYNFRLSLLIRIKFFKGQRPKSHRDCNPCRQNPTPLVGKTLQLEGQIRASSRKCSRPKSRIALLKGHNHFQ